MSRRHRAVALGALAVLLGVLAASDVAGREAALDRRVGPAVPVVVARVDLPAGAVLRPAVLAVRRVPARFAPAGAFRAAGQLRGLTTAVAVAQGTDLVSPLVRDPEAAALHAAEEAGAGGDLRPGERVAEIVARGDARLLGPGSRVDLLVTREDADGGGGTTVALEDVEVVAAADAPTEDGRDTGPHVALSLRVSLRQAVALAAAQSFAKELRVLVRADGDHRHGAQGLTVTDG